MKALHLCLTFFIACMIQAERIQLTVFIHGTVGSLCLMPYPRLAHKPLGEITALWGTRLQHRYRMEPLLKHFWPMHDLGMKFFSTKDLDDWATGQMSPESYKHAMYPISYAYHTIGGLTTPADSHWYATFGWSGILHDEARAVASKNLYEELIAWQQDVVASGDTPSIKLVCHSHGGNVALKLPNEERLHQKHLCIDTLIMMGTPIQEETIYGVDSDMFTTVINYYALYDVIQKGDIYSTRNKKCYQRLSDRVDCKAIEKRNPSLRRMDVNLLVNGSSWRIDHANMWILGKSMQLTPETKMLPYVIFSPLVESHIHKCQGNHIYANLITSKTSIALELRDIVQHHTIVENIKTLVDAIQSTILSLWKPDEKGSSLFFSKTNPLLLLFRK